MSGQGVVTTVSVAMTTFNGIRYVEEQLDSLRAQTRQPDQVIIADDGSTDGTFQVVQDYIRDHGLVGWRAYQNERNLGWRRNFVQTVQAAEGDLVFLCDQDDRWHPRKIELMERAMGQNPRIDLLACRKEDCPAGGLIPFGEGGPVGGAAVRELPPTNAILRVQGAPGCLYCVRRDFALRVIPYWREELEYDSLFWRYSALEHGRFELPLVLLHWRTHADSTFERERATHHTREWRLEDIRLSKLYLADMQRFCAREQRCSQDSRAVVERALRWCDLRERFIGGRSVGAGLELLGYGSSYLSWKQAVRDWIFLFQSD